MTGLQVALCGGLMIGLAAALLVYRLAPSDPHLGDVLDRLAPEPLTRATSLDPSVGSTGMSASVADRIGGWAMRTLPGVHGRAPRTGIWPSSRSARPASTARRSCGPASA